MSADLGPVLAVATRATTDRLVDDDDSVLDREGADARRRVKQDCPMKSGPARRVLEALSAG